ncbi:MAG: FFLEELY motif protein [Thermodesulfobacteriota bacterium]
MNDSINSGKQADRDRFFKLKRALQAFQSARLSRTYKDIKENPEYAKIGVFFFEKLYAPEDFSFRDESIRKLHKLLKGKIYTGIISAVNKVIELHELTDELDNLMVVGMIDLGVGPDLTMQQYQEVYRRLDNYDQRLYQIRLSTDVTRTFHRLSKKWLVALSLNTVRSAAHLIGMGKILDFIYEAYEGFRAIKNIDFFVETVEQREIAWHNEIWSAANK